MPINILVPELGESVVEATVAEWLKKEGEPVAAGEPLVKLETDKVDLEVAAERAGVLAHIAQPAGADVKVGDVLGTLEAAGGQADHGESGAGEGRAMPAPTPAVNTWEGQPLAGQELAAAQAQAPAGQPGPDGAAQGGTVAAQAAHGAGPAEEKVTPVARRVAEDLGVDVTQIQGRGPGGRVTKEDVESYAAAGQRAPAATGPQPVAAQPAPAAAPARPSPTPVEQPQAAPLPQAAPQTPVTSAAAGRREERARMSRRRQTIAARLVEAQHTAAMLTTFNEIDMSAVMEVRKRRRDSFKERYGVSLGFMSFFVKASIGALKAFPRLNGEIQGVEIVLKRYYDIGIAIGAADGLVVPVLRDADRLSFAEIERAIKEYAGKVEAGTLTLDDLRGGTFTITNGGVFGSLLSTPILNPPQVGILGMHKIEERPVAVGGQVVIRPMMYVALSYDHRIVDGREAVQFLVRVKELVEDPESLLLEG